MSRLVSHAVEAVRDTLERLAEGDIEPTDAFYQASEALNRGMEAISEAQERHARSQVHKAVDVDYQVIVAANLKRLRLDSGTTQANLAGMMERFGFSWTRVTVAEVEGCKRKVSLDELTATAALYGVPLVQLLLPRPSQRLRFPGGRTVEPQDLIAMVTGGGYDVDSARGSWAPALGISGVRPWEDDWRPAPQLPELVHPWEHGRLLDAARLAEQKRQERLIAYGQARESTTGAS